MLMSEAIVQVRSATLHDQDTQFENTQLLSVLGKQYRILRRWLCLHVPQLCEAIVSGIAVTGGTGVILKSALATFERLIRVEKLVGTTYVPLEVSDSMSASNPAQLSVTEQPAQLLINPKAYADGTYQVIYATGAPALTAITTSTDADLPDELLEVMIEQGCAWARQRHRESWEYHIKRAESMMREAASLKVRYRGMHVSGMKRTR